jgi:hypothetical protein
VVLSRGVAARIAGFESLPFDKELFRRKISTFHRRDVGARPRLVGTLALAAIVVPAPFSPFAPVKSSGLFVKQNS